mgnify:CR=1 FL=1
MGGDAPPFAEVLPWDAFSLRVAAAHVPRLHELLANVTRERVVATARDLRLGLGHVRLLRAAPRHAGRRLDPFGAAAHAELVPHLPRGIREDVDDQDLVGQEEDEVALRRVTHAISRPTRSVNQDIPTQGYGL